MRENKKSSQFKALFIFTLLFAFILDKKGSDFFAQNNPIAIPHSEVNPTTPIDGFRENNSITPLAPTTITNNEKGIKSEFEWTTLRSIDRTAYMQSQRFNWFRRKILSEKTFQIYNNIVSVIKNIIKSVGLFKEKIKEVDDLKGQFDTNIKKKITEFNAEFYSFSQIFDYINLLEKQFLICKDSHLYIHNKEFRKKIDRETQLFINIRSMLKNIEENKTAFDQTYMILLNSVQNLEDIKEQTKLYEEEAWNKYQQLDELINDQNANRHFLEVSNIFDNITNYNGYIRNTFLRFFNQGIANLSDGSEGILSLVDSFFVFLIGLGERIQNFELEINQEIKKEKEKFLAEQEEARLKEEAITAAAMKKKLALEAEKNQLPWYKKFLSNVSSYKNDIIGLIEKHLSTVIAKITNQYNAFFNKSSQSANIKELIPHVSQKQETTIVENLSEKLPSGGGSPEVITIAPTITTHSNLISEPKLPENPIIENSTIITENVFEQENKTSPVALKEKEKMGSASYPKKSSEIRQQLPTEITNGENNQQPSPIAATEEILINQQQPIDQSKEQFSEKEPFSYKQTQLKDQEYKDLTNPLVDLSALEKNINRGNRSDLAISSPTVFAMEVAPESHNSFQRNIGNKQENQKINQEIKRANQKINQEIKRAKQNKKKRKNREKRKNKKN
jgi:hypothetical protein